MAVPPPSDTEERPDDHGRALHLLNSVEAVIAHRMGNVHRLESLAVERETINLKAQALLKEKSIECDKRSSVLDERSRVQQETGCSLDERKARLKVWESELVSRERTANKFDEALSEKQDLLRRWEGALDRYRACVDEKAGITAEEEALHGTASAKRKRTVTSD